jgi:prepilin-type N-terminal cleavage/methylation domain-containing protein
LVIDMWKKNRGFTLVELMVTVTLLAFFGVVLAKTVGTSSWMAHYRLKSAARDLATNLERARSNTIKENREWAVVFDTGANTYQLWRGGTYGKLSDTDAAPVPESLVTLSKYKNGIKFGRRGIATAPSMGDISGDVTFSANKAGFDRRGLPSPAAGFCYLTNEQGAVYAVGVLQSGVIRVQRWTGTAWQ